ncbi:MAG TPA: DoxX family protein [Fimbriimonadaceae bacterium]|nr:DoxX family protein [Fimbriimonadaceae bacterium]
MNNYAASVTQQGSQTKSGFLQALVATRPGWGPVVLRLGLAAMLWPHGAQKLLGLFGGYGFSATMGAMSQSLPAAIVFLVIMGEFFGSILIASGFLTRFAAASVAVIMAGAALTVHLHNGFFMNWMGNQPGEGFEFHLLAISMAVTLLVQGAGSASIDLRLTKRAKD